MRTLIVKDLYKAFKAAHPAVDQVSFEVNKGEIIAVVGESGSGKTTLLRLIAGFEEPGRGEIYLAGKCVAGNNTYVLPEKRNIGLVFQDLALFPHITVSKNIAFGIKDRSFARDKTAQLMELIGLRGYEDRFPHQLSGGQQQRVAIARALAIDPAMLLLDEPFSSLDQSLKVQVRSEIKNIIGLTHATALLVTHDREDAFAMADRVLVMYKGKILQDGSPEMIYSHPANEYVARLGGKLNIIPAALYSTLGIVPRGRSLGIRPEHLILNTGGNGVGVKIVKKVFSGSYFEYSVNLGIQEFICHSSQNFSIGEEVFLFFTFEYIHHFND